MSLLQPNPRPDEDRVTADFFTVNFRFTASVVVGRHRLGDILSDGTTAYLELLEVYVSRIDEPAKIISTFSKGTLAKERINFVLLPTQVEGIVKEQQHYFAKDSQGHVQLTTPAQKIYSVFMTLPSFNIYGNLTSRKLDTAIIMAAKEQLFLPIFEVTAYNSLSPDINFKGPIGLVNKALVEILCVDDSVHENV